jgi:solute carrier family 25 (mitochondrial carnitine/acylcarnitine transporter), member 20/29
MQVRMQTAPAGSVSSAASQSVVKMFAQTWRAEGVRGLYRGVSAPLAAVSPLFAVSFWGYDMGQRLVRYWYQYDSPVHPLSLAEKCWAGGFSAIPCTALMAPSERIKCLLQTSPGRYSGMADCAAQVYRQGGIASIYKGTVLTLMRDVPGSVAWFGTYEAVKLGMMQAQGMRDPSQLSPVSVLTAGGFAGMACWSVCIPFDVLKSRYQSAPEGTYKSVLDVYSQLMKNEGPSALFTGIRPALIRAFPANAACFLGMELARKSLAFMD